MFDFFLANSVDPDEMWRFIWVLTTKVLIYGYPGYKGFKHATAGFYQARCPGSCPDFYIMCEQPVHALARDHECISIANILYVKL